MIRNCFNKGWIVGPAVSSLQALMSPAMAASPKDVNLPHDAMIMSDRDPSYPTTGGSAFFKAENTEYQKTFMVSKEDKGKVIYLEFEGAYMNTFVWVNGGFAGKHMYGYSNFYVRIDDFIKYGQDNTIKVLVKNSSQPNARWYSGAGIYRNVKLIVGEQLHIKLDGVMISTPTIKPEMAVER